MAQIDTLRRLVEPIVADLGADIYDLEFVGGTLRVSVDRPGGVDLDTIAEVTRQVSRQLDLDDPIPGKYTLEVSSPGLERNLRHPAHWSAAVGERVKIKTLPSFDGERRYDAVVAGSDDTSVTLRGDDGPVVVPFDAIDRARTVFEWGPTPKPGGPNSDRAPKPVPSAPSDSLKESESR